MRLIICRARRGRENIMIIFDVDLSTPRPAANIYRALADESRLMLMMPAR